MSWTERLRDIARTFFESDTGRQMQDVIRRKAEEDVERLLGRSSPDSHSPEPRLSGSSPEDEGRDTQSPRPPNQEGQP